MYFSDLYSFVQDYELQWARFPTTLNYNPHYYHCSLTPSGEQKIKDKDTDLRPTEDYYLRGPTGRCRQTSENWYGLHPDSPLRDVVVVVRAAVPRTVVMLGGYPIPKDATDEELAK